MFITRTSNANMGMLAMEANGLVKLYLGSHDSHSHLGLTKLPHKHLNINITMFVRRDQRAMCRPRCSK